MAAVHKVLILIDGIHYNVIKIKPPLCFDKENADYLVESLDATLTDIY